MLRAPVNQQCTLNVGQRYDLRREQCRADPGQLARELRALGLRHGQSLLVQCSLRRVGPIAGGAAALLDAIASVVGPEAAIVVPTQTTLNSFTSSAFRAATAGLDAAGRARYIADMPGFDSATTPSEGMGAFAEYVRRQPGAHRSRHPQVSFAAVGGRAAACTAVHDLDCHLGDRSPLGWLYETNAAVLLVGVPYSACTAFHLAEYRLDVPPVRQRYHCFTREAGVRVRHEFTDLLLDDSDFSLLGSDLEMASERDVGRGQLGKARSRRFSLRFGVEFARSWIGAHRNRGMS